MVIKNINFIYTLYINLSVYSDSYQTNTMKPQITKYLKQKF